MYVVCALERAARILQDVQDILDCRVVDPEVPMWCERRGWAEFLLSLRDSDLVRCEQEGMASHVQNLPQAPASLRLLAAQVLEMTSLPGRAANALPIAMASVPERKQIQLGSFMAVCDSLVRSAKRLVDVGAGRGHLTRLAAGRFGKPAVGLEREPSRVGEAIRLAGEANAQYLVVDAFEQDLDLREGDLAMGLHACGELGDVMLRSVVRARCDAVLVSCCLQKVRQEFRLPISIAGQRLGLAIRRDTLGLANLLARPVGVEATTEHAMHGRQTRFALRLLLRDRGIQLPPGDEMRGLNRRRAWQGLRPLAEQALSQRDQPTCSNEEVQHFERLASLRFGMVRRLSLPRNMLGRLLEVAVVLDRASLLAEHGYKVQIVPLVDPSVTPRNLALLGSVSGASFAIAPNASDD